MFSMSSLHPRLSVQTERWSIVLVVQPIVAIMRDHIKALLSKDLSAAFVNHKQKDSVIRQRVLEGKY